MRAWHQPPRIACLRYMPAHQGPLTTVQNGECPIWMSAPEFASPAHLRCQRGTGRAAVVRRGERPVRLVLRRRRQRGSKRLLPHLPPRQIGQTARSRDLTVTVPHGGAGGAGDTPVPPARRPRVLGQWRAGTIGQQLRRVWRVAVRRAPAAVCACMRVRVYAWACQSVGGVVRVVCRCPLHACMCVCVYVCM